jgi:hypothetical protein
VKRGAMDWNTKQANVLSRMIKENGGNFSKKRNFNLLLEKGTNLLYPFFYIFIVQEHSIFCLRKMVSFIETQ